jgi:uncharacterized membrane protein
MTEQSVHRPVARHLAKDSNQFLRLDKLLLSDSMGFSYMQNDQPKRNRKEEILSETGLTAVLLMVFAVILLIKFWREILICVLFAFMIVFCCGVYYIFAIMSAWL